MLSRLVLVAMLASSPAWAEPEVPQKTRDFANKATVAGLYEVQTSQLALKYAKQQPVKTFAQQMITDHEDAAKKLKASLSAAGVAPPRDQLDVTHAAKYGKLRVFTTEAGFDSAYIDAQVEAHQDAVATFTDYAQNGPTPQVKSFAQDTLPVLQHHLSMVEELRKTVPKP